MAAGPERVDFSEARSVYQRQFQTAGDDADIYYPLHLLRNHPERQTCTDSHYSAIGNLHLAAHVVETATGVRDPAHVASREAAARKAKIIGDLGLQCIPQRQEELLILPPPKQAKTASNGLVAGNNGSIDLVENTTQVGTGTLLIFGDSFFRIMLKELAHYWDRIIYVRTQHFHYELVAAARPTAIVMGMAERVTSAHNCRMPSVRMCCPNHCSKGVPRPQILSFPICGAGL